MGKLSAHLYYAKSCRRTLHSRNYACTLVPGKGSHDDQQRSQEHDRLLPPLQAEGPHLPPLRLREETEVDNDLHMFLMETFLDLENVETAIQHIMEEMARRPTSWTTWTATLRYFVDTLDENDAQSWPVQHNIVQDRLRALLDPSCWNLDRPMVKPSQSLEDLEQECRDVAVTDWSGASCVPRDFCRHRVFLHIFSGRRRPGDVQFFLDRMDSPSHYVLHVVSMDVIVDKVWGDAMAVGTRDYWQKAALDGFVVAFLAGPPCETWSKARGQGIALDKSRRLPRILRSAEHLWGLPSLALKEMAQVLTGNQLLTFSLLMAATMVQTGGCGALEHPAEPDDDMAASIWKLPTVLALLQAPRVCRHRLAQGLFGAPSAKATDLMLINLPDIVYDLRQWMTRRELPRGSSIGLTAEGQWRTGILKEYPPAMCGALASSFRRAIDRIPTTAGVEPTATDVTLWESLTVTQYSTHFGADYVR